MAERQLLDVNLNVFEGEEMHTEQENESRATQEDAETNCIGNQRQKRRRFHRHTADQIQKMEAFFKDCPHPNKKQRSELGEELGLEPLQVKFWFQNKRTHMKSKNERQEVTHLRVENEKLHEENMKYREAISSACCPSCGCMVAIGDVSVDDHHLRLENTRLREEIERISAVASKYVGKPFPSSVDAPSSSVPCSNDHGASTISKGTLSHGKEKVE